VEDAAAPEPRQPHRQGLIATASRLHLFSTYADVIAVLRDPDGFGSERSPDNVLLSTKDGEDHTRLRSALQSALSAGVIAALEPTIRLRAGALAHDIARSGRADLVPDYVIPLTRSAVAALLSIEPDDEAAVFGALRERDDATVDAFLRSHAARTSRRAPDTVGQLIAAGLDHDRELLPHMRMLLQAGHGTMVDLVADVLLDLVSAPESWAHVDQPGADDAMNRVLRARAPLPFIERRARRECTVGSATIDTGDTIVLALASANRDRSGAELPHLALGAGVHSCLGGSLLRCVTRCAVTELHRAAPQVELVDGGVERDETNLADRGLVHLCILVGAQSP